MERIPNISLTEDELNQVLDQERFFYGGEASLYLTDNPRTLYKIYNVGKNAIHMNENKVRKIAKLYQMRLKHSVQPLSTISYNGEVIGYEMTRDLQDEQFRPYLLQRAEKIHVLEQAQRILEYYHSQGIIYGDVVARNILINRYTGEVKFCDMDNICLGEYPIDVVSWQLGEYTKVGGIDENADAYMHNIMTLLETFYLSPRYEPNSIFKKEFETGAEKILLGMKKPEIFDGEYVIQYIKK